MTTRFASLSIRGQFLTFVVLCGLFLTVAWRVVLQPARLDLAARKTRLAAADDEVERARARASRLPALLRDVRAMERLLDQTTGIGPGDMHPDEVLRNVHQLASEASLELSSFAPKAGTAKPHASEWALQLSLEGRYHDLGRFLNAMAALSRPMLVSDLQIKATGQSESEPTITATCVATIITLVNSDAPAPAAARSSSTTGDAK